MRFRCSWCTLQWIRSSRRRETRAPSVKHLLSFFNTSYSQTRISRISLTYRKAPDLRESLTFTPPSGAIAHAREGLRRLAHRRPNRACDDARLPRRRHAAGGLWAAGEDQRAGTTDTPLSKNKVNPLFRARSMTEGKAPKSSLPREAGQASFSELLRSSNVPPTLQ